MNQGPSVVEAQVTLRNRHGLHARQAHLFVQVANAYASSVQVQRADSDEQVLASRSWG